MLTMSWFENNYMKCNKYTDYCHLIVPSYKHEQVLTNIEKNLIWESNDVNFLRLLLIKTA